MNEPTPNQQFISCLAVMIMFGLGIVTLGASLGVAVHLFRVLAG